MTYCWECAKCEGVTEVQRPVADIDKTPEVCDHCGNQSFSRRVILRNDRTKSYILADTGLGWPSHGFYNKPYWPEKK